MPSSLKKDTVYSSVELDMPEGEGGTERDLLMSNGPDTVSRSTSDSENTVDFREPISSTKDEVDGQQQTSSSKSPFTDRQNFVRQLCDASMLAANVSQLRVVLDGGSENSYYIPLLLMIGFSLLFHIGFGFLMIHRWRKEREAEMSHKKSSSQPGTPSSSVSALSEQAKGVTCFCSSCLTVERCDEISMFIMLIIVVLNVFIAGLGLSGPSRGGTN